MKFDRILIFILLSTSNTYSQLLDKLAIKYKTDKSSQWHNYTSTYEKYLYSLKNKPIKFLEIGFQYGNSARMWNEYFTHNKSLLFFIDNDQECTKYNLGLSKRCKLYFADQSKKKDLLSFLKKSGSNFDIIIDDGGHEMKQQITSFTVLFPHLKSGGIYIIEDLHTSYWKSWGAAIFNGYGTFDNPKSGPGTTSEFLKLLIDDLNYIPARTTYANREKGKKKLGENLSFYQKNIRELHFYTSLCIIVKD